MATALTKIVVIPQPPQSVLLSTAVDGSQVWRDYVWDVVSEAWKPAMRTRPAPPRPVIQTPPPEPLPPPQPRTISTPLPLPTPTVRDPFGVLAPNPTADTLMAMQLAYQARYRAWYAAYPGASILDFPG
jgi:hypothetical protein